MKTHAPADVFGPTICGRRGFAYISFTRRRVTCGNCRRILGLKPKKG